MPRWKRSTSSAVAGGRGRGLSKMRLDDWSGDELADAERYANGKEDAVLPGADKRYVFYVANQTTNSRLLVREVDVDRETRDRPSGTWTGDIVVALPDGSIVAVVDESRCWT